MTPSGLAGLMRPVVDRVIIESSERASGSAGLRRELHAGCAVRRLENVRRRRPMLNCTSRGRIQKALDRKVSPSQACISSSTRRHRATIDVNTGASSAPRKLEGPVFRPNLEAPDHARQLRLRNLGGIIIIGLHRTWRSRKTRRKSFSGPGEAVELTITWDDEDISSVSHWEVSRIDAQATRRRKVGWNICVASLVPPVRKGLSSRTAKRSATKVFRGNCASIAQIRVHTTDGADHQLDVIERLGTRSRRLSVKNRVGDR